MATNEDAAQYEMQYQSGYPGRFDAAADGQWFSAVHGGQKVGVVWTNNNDGFGFIPADVDVAPAAHEAIDAFRVLSDVASKNRLSVDVAYQAAKQMAGYSAADERRGRLKDVYAAMDALNAGTIVAAGIPYPKPDAPAGSALPDGETEDGPVEPGPDEVPADAADAPFPNGKTALAEGDTLAVTVDDTDTVLELIYSDESGVYVRDNGSWQIVDTDQPQPTIDDLEWDDVTPEFITVFDGLSTSQDAVSKADAAQYLAPQDYDTPES